MDEKPALHLEELNLKYEDGKPAKHAYRARIAGGWLVFIETPGRGAWAESRSTPTRTTRGTGEHRMAVRVESVIVEVHKITHLLVWLLDGNSCIFLFYRHVRIQNRTANDSRRCRLLHFVCRSFGWGSVCLCTWKCQASDDSPFESLLSGFQSPSASR